MTRVTIDGVAHEVEDGLTILAVLRRLGRDLPALCDDPRLAPAGLCRTCVVGVAGVAHPVAACLTPVADGMAIDATGPEPSGHRRTALELLAARYPPEAVARDPEHPFHRLLHGLGLAPVAGARTRHDPVDDAHPYIRVDMARCIDCFRCVRICADLQGQFVWQALDRGDHTQIVPDSGTTLRASSCVSCGACSDSCPTGALSDRAPAEQGAPETWTRTTCGYCGTGCEPAAGTRDGRLVMCAPVLDAPVSKGHLCVKGRYATAFVHAGDRVTTPLLRDGGDWRPVSWEAAIGVTAERLRAIAARRGADAIGVLGSARATNEENYLAQKLARLVLGTNNVDCCARVCHAPSAAALKAQLGTGAATNSFDDIELAHTILVCGANPTENHPIVGARIRQAVRRGARLVVIDPRRIELAAVATCHLAPRPGTNIPLLNALAHVIVVEGLVDASFVRERVTDLDAFHSFIVAWTPERAAAVCGVAADEVRRAARLYATGGPAFAVHGLGVTEHGQGTDGVRALINLALLTGNLGRPGTGINPLRGQNNVQGAALMGCDPGHLPGGAPLAEGAARVAAVWGAPPPSRPGLHMLEMMDAARAGRLQGLWAIGYDVLLTNADAATTRAALAALELVVVQDLFLNETAREFGHVFLPACSSFEKDGTFMNAERRVQRVRAALPPQGESRPDWRILGDVAAALGAGAQFAFPTPEAVWDEVRSVWPAVAGITWARLEHGGLQWPCPSEDHPGTMVLHGGRFAAAARAPLARVDYRPTPETTDDAYPFLLTTGRTLWHFNAGTMTLRTPNAGLRAADVLEMAPADAARLGLADGARVRVRSRTGETVLPLRLDPRLAAGTCFTTFHTAEAFVNQLTSSQRDAVTGAPEYKVTAVAITRA
jgi:formate dehydrogenase major subunit